MTHSEYGLGHGHESAELKGETQAEGVEIKRGPTEPEESSALQQIEDGKKSTECTFILSETTTSIFCVLFPHISEEIISRHLNKDSYFRWKLIFYATIFFYIYNNK